MNYERFRPVSVLGNIGYVATVCPAALGYIYQTSDN